MTFQEITDFIRNIYQTDKFIPLHEPLFIGNEKSYLNECIESTFVSSVGKFVNQFEDMIAKFTGAKYAIATSNGTSALHITLLLAGVQTNDEVITQPLTFVATCNAINYCNAHPVFVDVDKNTMGLSPDALESFLHENTRIQDGQCINTTTGRIIKACVPMHTFGHPCRILKIAAICKKFNIQVIEDAAESLGSYIDTLHSGRIGLASALSFNGNKTITTGGGGIIITDDQEFANQAKHLTTTAKTPHPYEYIHDQIGYNYRMPNLNAALGVAQMEQLDAILSDKRKIAQLYADFFKKTNSPAFAHEPPSSRSNYWLNAIIFHDQSQRDAFIEHANKQQIMVRPIWTLMPKLTMFKHCQSGPLDNSMWLSERVVNIPSGARTLT